MFVKQMELGPMQNFTYIIFEQNSGRAVLIDPCWKMDMIEEYLASNNLKPEAVLLTHGHYDHYRAIEPFLKKHEISAQMHAADLYLLDGLSSDLVTTFDGDTIINAAGLAIQAISTPGHSPGSVCYYVDDCVFTGDTLFGGTVGRTDLPGSNPRAMTASLRRLSTLPENTKIYSGHNYGPERVSSIWEEIRSNPEMRMALRNT